MSPPGARQHGRRARAWLSYLALRMGRTGGAGVALCVLAIGMLLAGAVVRGRTLAMEGELAAIRRGDSAVRATPRAVRDDPGLFIARLAPPEQLPLFVEGIQRQAQRAGLQIDRADYRSPPLADGRVLRVQVVLPLRGTYPQIARWLEAVLREQPGAAIDELSLQRDAPGSAQLRARVVLSHYTRAPR